MNQKIKDMINQSSPQAYDGHSRFQEMTPDERLSWLDEANDAYLEFHNLAGNNLRVAEEKLPYGAEGGRKEK